MTDDIAARLHPSLALEGAAAEAYRTLTAMVCESPLKPYPTGYLYPEEVRAAAEAMAAEIAALKQRLQADSQVEVARATSIKSHGDRDNPLDPQKS